MKNIVRLLRPHQWLKNLMLLFPPFLAGKIGGFSWFELVVPLVSFSLLSSSSYIFNDILDVAADRCHPRKRLRPVAAGVVSVAAARLLALLLATAAFALATWQVPEILPWLLIYALLALLYTLFFKHVAVVDIVAIAAFFLIRLLAGGAAFHVHVSGWLFGSVLLLALFLSAGKRLGELAALGDVAVRHRSSLRCYTRPMLLRLLYVCAVAVLFTYAMYCVSHGVLLSSVPLCALGLWRYIRRVRQGCDGDPTASLLRDPVLFVVGAVWLVLVSLAVYAG